MNTLEKMNAFVSGLIEKAETSINNALDGCKDDSYRLELIKDYMPIVETLASVTAKINQ